MYGRRENFLRAETCLFLFRTYSPNLEMFNEKFIFHRHLRRIIGRTGGGTASLSELPSIEPKAEVIHLYASKSLYDKVQKIRQMRSAKINYFWITKNSDINCPAARKNRAE